MSFNLEKIYASAPVWVQNIGISLYGYYWKQRRFGGHFQEYVKGFTDRDVYSSDEWQRYQEKALQRLLHHAYQHVPFYHSSLTKSGFKLDDLVNFKLTDIGHLPILEKRDILEHPDQFISRTAETNKLRSYLTSGTTGTPVKIQFSPQMHQQWSAAYEVRCRNWAGVNFKMSRGMIGGRIVVPQGMSKPPFWRYNMAERQLYLSAFHISPRTVQSYIDALNKHKPEYLVGYASAHYFLARMIEEADLKVYSPKAILMSSEKLTEEMRATLRRVYQCSVFDAYSGLEANCLISECENYRMHISPDVGIVELLNERSTRVVSGQEGEIIATGLLNFDQPLIRYRMGDIAIASNEACACGRSMPVIKELIGRLEDTVIGIDGREMVRFHGIFVGLKSVREGQIVQETSNHFIIKVVTSNGIQSQDKKVIESRFRERLGPVKVEIQAVQSIERTSRGKFRAVISKVPRSASRTTC